MASRSGRVAFGAAEPPSGSRPCGLNVTSQSLYTGDEFLFGSTEVVNRDFSAAESSLHASMNPYLFPARGSERPALRQVLSDPGLQHVLKEQLGETRDLRHPEDQDGYRHGLGGYLRELDRLGAKRRHDEHREAKRRDNVAKMKVHHEQSLAAARSMKVKSGWVTENITRPYFEQPKLEGSESVKADGTELLKGTYTAPEMRGQEKKKIDGWKQHNRNDKHEILAEFGTKKPERMLPSERKFHDKFVTRMAQVSSLEAQDALENSIGSLRRKRIEASLEPHSSLRSKESGQALWRTGQISTHTFFSEAEGHKPGDILYDTAIANLAASPERAMDNSKDIIAGDAHRSSHWKPPRNLVAGSTRRADEVKRLTRQWLPKNTSTVRLDTRALPENTVTVKTVRIQDC